MGVIISSFLNVGENIRTKPKRSVRTSARGIPTPRKKPLSVAAEVFLQMLRSGRREPQTALARGERKSVVNLVSLAPLWLSFIYSILGEIVDDVSLLASALI